MSDSYDNLNNAIQVTQLKYNLQNIQSIGNMVMPSESYYNAMQQALSGSSRIIYMVRPGDSLESIAQKVKIPVVKLMQLNPDVSNNPYLIYPGQILKLTHNPKERKEEKKVSEKKTTLTLEDYDNIPGYFIKMRETGHYSPNKQWKWEIYSGHGDDIKYVCEDFASTEADCLLGAEYKLKQLLKPHRIKRPNRFLHSIFL